jgi:hypothetical protein
MGFRRQVIEVLMHKMIADSRFSRYTWIIEVKAAYYVATCYVGD